MKSPEEGRGAGLEYSDIGRQGEGLEVGRWWRSCRGGDGLSVESQRRRRIYLVPGGYLLVEIAGKKAEVSKRGKSTLIILGNRFTREFAYQRLGASGKPPELSSMRSLFEEAMEATASVSPDYTLLTSDEVNPNPEAVLLRALREDCEEGGWELTGLV